MLETLFCIDKKFAIVYVSSSASILGKIEEGKIDILHRINKNQVTHRRGGQAMVSFTAQRAKALETYKKINISKINEQFFFEEKFLYDYLIFCYPESSENLINVMFKYFFLNDKLKKLFFNIEFNGDNTLNEIHSSLGTILLQDYLSNQKENLLKFFELSNDVKKVCFGVSETLKALEKGLLDTIFISEELQLNNSPEKENGVQNCFGNGLVGWVTNFVLKHQTNIFFVIQGNDESLKFRVEYQAIGGILKN